MLLNPAKIDETDLFLMKSEHISFIRTGSSELYKAPRWAGPFLVGIYLVGFL